MKIDKSKKTKVKPMSRNERMRKLIELLAGLEASNHDELNEYGRKYMGEIWNLLGMPSKEEIHKSKEKK